MTFWGRHAVNESQQVTSLVEKQSTYFLCIQDVAHRFYFRLRCLETPIKLEY